MRKSFGPMKYLRGKIWTHEIPTRKKLGPPKNPRGKISDPQINQKYFCHTKARWHDGTRPTRPTTARDPRNLAHSLHTLVKDYNSK